MIESRNLHWKRVPNLNRVQLRTQSPKTVGAVSSTESRSHPLKPTPKICLLLQRTLPPRTILLRPACRNRQARHRYRMTIEHPVLPRSATERLQSLRSLERHPKMHDRLTKPYLVICKCHLLLNHHLLQHQVNQQSLNLVLRNPRATLSHQLVAIATFRAHPYLPSTQANKQRTC